ncbi:MAG: SMC-Scp complex subunit ScpB [Gammaproteobacteria bacterium]|nr:SMC-Scp complex subunit ScpB [Gammaproteobacteria bacterium]MYC26220.1 SMC-Scp complex subunit ScpB [Gammaproteobacteria bacterium]
MLAIAEVKRIVEALLLVSESPLTQQQIINVIEDDPEKQQELLELVPRALYLIEQDCETRPYELTEVKSGFRLQIGAEMSAWVAKLLRQKPRKYSRATLETLVLIAYRQPITRGEIEQIRGVSVNTNTIRNLMDRGWVKELGTRNSPGRPMTYGTTATFLDYFGLRSLDELPELEEANELSMHVTELGIERLPNTTSDSPKEISETKGSDEPSSD